MMVLLKLLLIFVSIVPGSSLASGQKALKVIYSSIATTTGGAETEYGAGMDTEVRIRMLMQPEAKLDSLIVMQEKYTFTPDSFPEFSGTDTLELILNVSWYSDIPRAKRAEAYLWKRPERMVRGPWPVLYSGIVEKEEHKYAAIIFYSYKGKDYRKIIGEFDHASHIVAD